MNIFFVFDDGSLTTPPLGGTILPGITRDSIITLARGEGRNVREERYSIEQWRADVASGRLREAFACGTAAVVSAIGRDQKSANGDILIGDGDGGPVTDGAEGETRRHPARRGRRRPGLGAQDRVSARRPAYRNFSLTAGPGRPNHGVVSLAHVRASTP